MSTDLNNELQAAATLEQVGDRLGFSLLLAATFHVVLILGLGFSIPRPDLRAPSLEITITTHPSETPVEQADYLAQFNQQASGDQGKPAELTSPVESSMNAETVVPIESQPRPAAGQPAAASKFTTALVDNAEIQLQEQDSPTADQAESTTSEPEQFADSQLASLMAQLGEQQKAYAWRPRTMSLTTVAARESSQAQYLHNWKTRIESIGNANYPDEARQQRLYGDLRLLVAVRANGSVESIEVLQSSGVPVLDRAARRIVRLAEPFDAFPPDLAAQADTVEIIRTWQFSRNRLRATN